MKIFEKLWRGPHRYDNVYSDMNMVFRLVCRGSIDPENLYFEYSKSSMSDRKALVEFLLDISLITSNGKIPSEIDYDELIVKMLENLDSEIANRKRDLGKGLMYAYEYEMEEMDIVTLNNVKSIYTDTLLEKGIVKCPNCGAVLNGENTMYRSLIPDDNYFGLLDGEVQEIFEEMMAPPQNMYTELACVKCKENVEDYLRELEDEDKLILSLY